MSEIFAGRKGKLVALKDTIEGFSALPKIINKNK
jgi:F0F1-type ATP synthase beta subunit